MKIMGSAEREIAVIRWIREVLLAGYGGAEGSGDSPPSSLPGDGNGEGGGEPME